MQRKRLSATAVDEKLFIIRPRIRMMKQWNAVHCAAAAKPWVQRTGRGD